MNKFQYEKTLHLLRQNPSVTKEQANKEGVYNFRQRIAYLRSKGYSIINCDYQEYQLTDYGKALYQEPK